MLTLLTLLASAAAQSVHVVGPGGLPDLATAMEIAVDGDTIEIAPGAWFAELVLIERDLTFRGAGGSAVTELVGGEGSTMISTRAATVTFEGLTFRPTGRRALVVADQVGVGGSTVTLRDVVFDDATIELASDSWEPAMGPSLWIGGGSTVTIEGGRFEDVTPTGFFGGHVGVAGASTLIATDVVFQGATTTLGGALYAESSSIELTRCTFLGGAAVGSPDFYGTDIAAGGAVYAPLSALTVVGGAFHRNSAIYGGAVACDRSTCVVDDSTFEDNAAGSQGGAVMVYVSTFEGARDRFCDNGSVSLGGAMSVVDGAATLTSSVLCENTSTAGWGGAISLDPIAAVTSVVSRNNTYVGNAAYSYGGAIGASDAAVTSTNDLFVGNATTGGVGGTAVDDIYLGAVAVTHALFFDNPTGDASTGLDATSITGVDPLLADWIPGDCPSSDLTVRWGSPAIDAGDPAFLDPDGSISDIGAYGGPDADVDFFVDGDADGTIDPWDCAPADPDVHPLALELCDGVDQDCDASADEDAADAIALWTDADDDGFGAGAPTIGCPAPGLVADGSDCDDADEGAFPGAPELAGDGVDQDCDGADATTPTEPGGTGTPGGSDTDIDTDAPGVDTDGPGRVPGVDDTGTTTPDASGAGCGCDGTGFTAGQSPAVALLAVLGLRRRRARHCNETSHTS